MIHLSKAACLGLMGAILGAAHLQAQYLDLGFVPNPSSTVQSVAVQPDGKTLVAGGFTRISAVSRSYIARLNVNSTLDASFTPTLDARAETVVLQPDGKILVGGRFSTVNGQPRALLARFNAVGTLDETFNPVLAGTYIRAILVLPDGRIMIGGDLLSVNGQSRTALARLTVSGALDPTFTGDASGRTGAATPGIFALGRQSDGRILLGGQFILVNGQPRRGLARLSADGALDPAFDPMAGNTSVSIQAITVDRNGRILIGGGFSLVNNASRGQIARLTAEGMLDSMFNPVPDSAVFAIAEQPDGRVVFGGIFSRLIASPVGSGIARVNSNGTVDPTFTTTIGGAVSASSGGVNAILALPDGRLLIGGSFTTVDTAPRTALARIVPPSPHISPAPETVNATLGARRELTVAVSGAPATYQWRKDGVPIAGATGPVLAFAAIRLSDAGAYDLVATNSFGTATSTSMMLVVNTPPEITRQPSDTTVIAGSPAGFSVVDTASPASRYQWRKNGLAIAGATLATFVIQTARPADRRVCTCVVSNIAGAVTSAPATLTVLPRAQLANISVRAALATAQSLIVGFVVTEGAAPVLVRAAGPALATFGVSGAMSDPRIELYRDSTKVVENDNWPGALGPMFASVGAFSFPANSADAALNQLVAGSHSVVAAGTGAGVVLVEVYDSGPPGAARLANISARNQVGAGDNILIAGFSIGGFGAMRVLIRAVGPTLAGPPFGVPGVLTDPKLEVYDTAGIKVAENDNWEGDLAETFTAAGAFPLAPRSRDAALLTTLSSGRSYTVQVKGADGGTGVAIVEVYELR